MTKKIPLFIIFSLLFSTVFFNGLAHAQYYDWGDSKVIYGPPAWDFGSDCSASGYYKNYSSGLSKGNCVRWIKGTISEFKTAWNNRRGGPYTTNALNTCTNDKINTDGYVIYAGFNRYGTNRLSVFNTTEKWNSRNKSNFNHATVGTSTAYNNFFETKTKGGMTYKELLETVESENHVNRKDIVFFCEGMVTRTWDVPEDGNYTSESEAKVDNSSWSKTSSIYVNSVDNSNIATVFSFRHIITSHAPRSASPKWWVSSNISEPNLPSGQDTISAGGSRTVGNVSITKDVPLGTKLEICHTVKHDRYVKFIDHYRETRGVTTLQGTSIELTGEYTSQACAEAKHPYNFVMNPSVISRTPDGVVYAGESFNAEGQITISKKDADPYPTISHPDETRSKLIQFTISPNLPQPANTTLAGEISGSEPCAYFQGKLGANILSCASVKESSAYISPNEANVLKDNIIIPDLPTGTKYCLAVGAYHADSGDGYTLNNKWAISNATCFTIAKKPNFQVWNGGIYTKGSIATSSSTKVVNSGFGNFDSAAKTLFGSWDEQIVIANGAVNGFASGAALGYNGYGFGLPGGSSNTDFSKLIPLTISNQPTDKGEYGYANLDISDSLLSRLKSRYQPEDPLGSDSITEATDVLGGFSFSQGTHIIYSEGTVVIDHDLCYGPCDNNPSTLTLDEQKLSSSSISNLPQILIFAKNIEIKSNVSRIDAWLIASSDQDDGGILNTCSEFSAGVTSTASSDPCNSSLIIDGPAFAKQLKLNRSAGAYPGDGLPQDGNVLSANLANDGSITPAEIFNLRSDAYYWAYAEAQKSAEAITVYNRELAPRL